MFGILPEDPKEQVSIQRRAPNFHLDIPSKMLYRKSFNGVLLRCLSQQEAEETLKEVHAGLCGAHQAGPKLYDQIKRLGYYWPTMVADAMQFAKRCQQCQVHGDYVHMPPEWLHPTAISWPFEAWGMDIIGPISPPSSKGHRFIFAATDYFSKWSEAFAFSEMKTSSVLQFLRTNIICRFGIPKRFVHDNGPQFRDHRFYRFCDKYKIQSCPSTPYNPAANGLAEAFNKTLCKILKKMVSSHKRDWSDKLPEALWAYRITIRGPTHSTPFSLVYGCEAVVPLEVQIPSLRVSLQNEMTQESNVKLRLQELDNLDERRLEALQSVELYQARMAGSFDKRVRQRAHKKGDLVLAVKRPMVFAHKSKGKFEPKWEGPFVIDKVFSNGAYALLNMEGDRCMLPINGKFLKRYYP